jgi:hypothetical protein
MSTPFTARGPRNRDEIAVCVALLRQSPLWTASELSEAEIVDCWEELLLLGVASIDIVENKALASDLIDLDKAKTNIHYKYGFTYVIFAAYVAADVLQEILSMEKTYCDGMTYFLALYNVYRTDPTKRRPIPEIDKEGKLKEVNLNMLCSPFFHPDISEQLSFRSFKYLRHKGEFTRRVYASFSQFAMGFRHDIFVMVTSGKFFVQPLKDLGLVIAKEDPENARKSLTERRFLTVAARNNQVLTIFSLPDLVTESDEIRHSEYDFLFLDHSVKPTLRMTKIEQQFCCLLINGFSDEHMGRFIYKEDYDYYSTSLETLTHKMAVEPLESREEKLLTLCDTFFASVPGRIKGLQRQAAKKLGVQNTPECIVQALIRNSETMREIRGYIFSVYPWPEGLPSRRLVSAR